MSKYTLHGNTKRTTPRHIWMHSVYDLAKVKVEDGEEFCGRERLNRWYEDDMPVWMAADSLRAFVNVGKRHAKADKEVNYLRTAAKPKARR